MAPTAPAQEFFDVWKQQMEQGAQLWARMVSQTSPNGPAAPDPLNLWRPFIEQANDTWAKTMRQGAMGMGATDAVAQGKAMLDQWIAAWDKLLAETMQTEAFAQAMGKYLDQWLSAQAPIRKAAEAQMESTLQAMGVPSRNQVTGIARQLMDLDDRIEEVGNNVAALRAQLEKVLQERAAAATAPAPPVAVTPPATTGAPPPRATGGRSTAGGRTPKATEKR